jgi:kinesin family protein 6/9
MYNSNDYYRSERVSKTHSQGTLLNEAKHINTSLHYLELVITALRNSNRKHIPYRNSKITSVLRDSLGGNCRTVMVATMSLDETNAMESISTLKFAKRVGSIANEAVINEELQPQLVIAKLKKEVAALKQELALKGDLDPNRELSQDEKDQ